jgi:hypothetical protein
MNWKNNRFNSSLLDELIKYGDIFLKLNLSISNLTDKTAFYNLYKSACKASPPHPEPEAVSSQHFLQDE